MDTPTYSTAVAEKAEVRAAEAEIIRLRDALMETRQSLADAQRMLDDAQRLTKTGSWVIDPIGGSASCSLEGYRILGLAGKASSANYMECLANVHPDDLPAVLTGFGEAVQSGESRPLHYRILHPNGATTDVETVAQPIRDDAGRVVQVVGTVMDVTERNRTQNALHASETLARGQLGALTRMLEAVVHETAPDRLPEVVLRAIAQQFGAHGITVWLTDEATRRAGFAFQFIDDVLLNVSRSRHPAARLSLAEQDNPVWRRIIATKEFELCSDVAASAIVPFRDYNLSIGVAAILVVPMLIAGEVAGLLAIGFSERRELLPDEVELAQALANQAMLAVRLMGLSERSREAAIVAERNRVVRDVHDTLAHAFTGVIVQLEAAEDATSRNLVAEASGHVARAQSMARTGLQEARRSVMALRPRTLEEGDLATALRESLARMTAGTPLAFEFVERGARTPLAAPFEEHLLHIGQEAWTNAIRHARAQRIAVTLTHSADDVRLEIRDDGCGFDQSATGGGLGLTGIRARAASMRGQLSLDSAIGSGTTVLVIVPRQSSTRDP